MTIFYQDDTYLRKYFGKESADNIIPSLAEIYHNSFTRFLQPDVHPLKRKPQGLEGILRAIFPLETKKLDSTEEYNNDKYGSSYSNRRYGIQNTNSERNRNSNISEATKIHNSNIHKDIYFYSHYIVNKPLYNEEECKTKGLSYLSSVYIVTYKLKMKGDQVINGNTISITNETDSLIGKKYHSFKNLKELEKHIFILPIKGIPYLTSRGTFLINGIERAIVSQLQRCPGLYYSHGKVSDSHGIKLIPYYGVNLMYEQNKANKIFVRLSGKRRIPLLQFLSTIGFKRDEITSLFFNIFNVIPSISKLNESIREVYEHPLDLKDHVLYHQRISFNLKNILYGKCLKDIRDVETGKVILKSGSLIDRQIYIKLLCSTIQNNPIDNEAGRSVYSISDFIPLSSEQIRMNKVIERKSNKKIEDSDANSPDDLSVVSFSKHNNLNKKFIYCPVRKNGQSIFQKKSGDIRYLRIKMLEDLKSELSINSLTSFNKVMGLLKGRNTIYTQREREEFLQKTFLDPVYYNLSFVGRIQLNNRLELSVEPEHLVLTKLDILGMVNYIIGRKRLESESDSVYHIQNRKVRLPGELLTHLLLKSLLGVKQRKEYSSKFIEYRNDHLIINHKNYSLQNGLPLLVKNRIISIFDIIQELNLDEQTIYKLIYNKIYFLSPMGDKLYYYTLLQTKKEIDQFLTSSNLSQLLDQLNQLAELTHIRRISLLGPDGLQRDNVSLDTRDVQASFFGRICPIETPEGKSVGIVNSLTILSTIDDHGDILTPYLKVKNGKLTNEVHYLNAHQEYNYYIALSEEEIDNNRSLSGNSIYCRYSGEFRYVESSHINYYDLSSRKILSLSSSLIPFIEHNDGNRALMGSNMQRQAVPTLIAEPPVLGTGLEYLKDKDNAVKSFTNSQIALRDGYCTIATPLVRENSFELYEKPIISDFVSKSFISNNLINNFDNKLESINSLSTQKVWNNILAILFEKLGRISFDLSYIPIIKKSFIQYQKTNQKTYIYEYSNVKRKDTIISRSPMIDNQSTRKGEIALGHNILVGFMSMNGYSFEDSIVISDRLLKEGLFTSVHTKEFIAFDWDTYKTKERITKRIPNLPKKQLEHLDNSGVIKVGTSLKGGDILVGKILVDRKENSYLSERDRFLQGLLAGTGENQDYIKDTSERVSIDMEGHVIDVKKFFFSHGTLPELVYRKQKIQILENFYSYKFKKLMLKQYIISKIIRLMYFNNQIYKYNKLIYIHDLNKINQTEVNNLLSWIKMLKKDLEQGQLNNRKEIISTLNYGLHFNSFLKEKFNEFGKQEKIWSSINRSLFSSIYSEEDQYFERLISYFENINLSFKADPDLHHEFIDRCGEIKTKLKKLILFYFISRIELRKKWYQEHLKNLWSNIYYDTPNLPIRLVKILIGYKHRLKPGDKMTGRHGNKGVISQVRHSYDMPYLNDGTTIDIILNPIGISSRMNLGQVFEVHMGWASVNIAKYIAHLLNRSTSDSSYQEIRQYLYHVYSYSSKERSIISKLSNVQLKVLAQKLSRMLPISTLSFEGATESDLMDFMEIGGVNLLGQASIRDGRTGEQYDNPITVGYMHILKLNHLVDDKIHARFTGPYNRVTEQPLGGKALDGGQRFGEMEVWALQAYGAAYTLLDMLTVKSDYRASRSLLTRSSKKDYPEAFNVLLRELWCLGLNITLNI